jgi:hypothetical protein
MARRLQIAAAAALVSAALAGCGSESSTPPELGAGPNVGASINLADCSDWNQATTEERIGTIKQLKTFAGGGVVGGSGTNPPAGTGAILDDEKAYELLNRACDADFAQGFKLYKLYQRAAAFAGTPAAQPTQ